jgi:hypothetical protein
MSGSRQVRRVALAGTFACAREDVLDVVPIEGA